MNNLPAVVEYLDKSEFHALAPAGVPSSRVLAGFSSAVNASEKLRACTLDSLVDAAHDCSRLGLWPGPHGHVYLVPYGRTATPIVGYKGMIALAKRMTGARIEARLVHENDEFSLSLGTDPRIEHVPASDRGACVGAYAVARFPDGKTQFEHMTIDQVFAIRDRSPAKGDSPWTTDPGEMTRKTVVRRLCKYIGMDEGMGHAFAINDKAEGYGQGAPVTHKGGPRRNMMDAAARYSEPAPRTLMPPGADRPMDDAPEEVQF